MFLSPICYDMLLFIGYYVNDLDGSVVSIRQRTEKSHQIYDRQCISSFRYFIHIMITSCVDLEPFLLDISLDAMSYFNVFSDLIFVFRCKCIIILNQSNFNFHCKK